MVNKDKERYSFSKLSTFNDCKYAYWLTYIEHQKGVGNCFSSFGTEVHSIMERYAKGSLSLWDLASTYEKEFDTAVPEEFPSFPFCQDMRGLYYEQGLNYLRNFGGYPKYKILGVESQFDIAIDDWVFNGIIDLVYEDEQVELKNNLECALNFVDNKVITVGVVFRKMAHYVCFAIRLIHRAIAFRFEF